MLFEWLILFVVFLTPLLGPDVRGITCRHGPSDTGICWHSLLSQQSVFVNVLLKWKQTNKICYFWSLKHSCHRHLWYGLMNLGSLIVPLRLDNWMHFTIGHNVLLHWIQANLENLFSIRVKENYLNLKFCKEKATGVCSF